MAQCERKKCGEYNMLRCARDAGHTGECSFVVDSENDYPWNKLPKERECCGTFPRTPHRATCAKYRGKFKPFNAKSLATDAALSRQVACNDGLGADASERN
jgi:hypothetical protein